MTGQPHHGALYEAAYEIVGPRGVRPVAGDLLVENGATLMRLVDGLRAAGWSVTTGTTKVPGRPERRRSVRVVR